MAATSTLLCIHRNPVQLHPLKANGYGLITARNGSAGLRLLMSQSVDAVVLEFYLGLLDGAVVADEIKQVRPSLPIVMVGDRMELPAGTLKSVDAFVAESDGPEMLLATVQSALQTRLLPHPEGFSKDLLTCSSVENMPNPSRRQILLVDDDPSVRDSVATLLTSEGYDVVTAENGFGALSQLRKRLPEIIVSDLDMPGMSGFELLSVVRHRFPEILTIAMSGAYAGENLPPGVIADSFVAKGGPPKNLFRALKRLAHMVTSRSTDHKEISPTWICRNGHDALGMPYVTLTCPECLRAFQMNIVEETTGKVISIPCRFCPTTNQYIIQPSSQVNAVPLV
jgi:CheY-like chemotaxis protein